MLVLTPEQERLMAQMEQDRLAKLDATILPPELKEEKTSLLKKAKSKIRIFFSRFTDSKKKYIVPEVGRPAHPEYAARMTRPKGEVIEPFVEDTVEDIAEAISNAATDREFKRIIVYPIEGETRKRVLELLESDPERYPMFEYRSANIVDNEDLNARSIIYMYREQSHICKPI